MKTQKKNRSKILRPEYFIITLLLMSACGENNKPAPSQKDAKEIKIKVPSLDIHAAALMGNLEAIEEHVTAKSDLNAKDAVMGSTPLIIAAVFGKTEVAKALIEAGADVNIQNNEGSTALHSAAFLCRTEIVKMLLENGANKDILNNYGSSALASVEGPFSDVKFIYDQFSKDLGPLGLVLSDKYLEKTRPLIADMLK